MRLTRCYYLYLLSKQKGKPAQGIYTSYSAEFLFDFKRHLDLKGATWIYSLWLGYFERSKSLRNLKSFLEGKGVRYEYLHTSGHAKLDDLKKLADAMTPEIIIPIHTFFPEKFKDYFPNARTVNDGETVAL